MVVYTSPLLAPEFPVSLTFLPAVYSCLTVSGGLLAKPF